MRGEPRLSFKKPGHLLKAKGIIGKHRVPLREIALGLVLYQLGLSFRKTAEVLGRPFYRFGKHFPLGKIPKEEFAAFIRARFEATGF